MLFGEVRKLKKRVCIYVTYDPQGYVGEYIEYCLRELSSVAEHIIVVSNHALDQETGKRLGTADQVYECSNAGYDAGAFSYAVNKLAKEDELKNYDEMIFINDSVFGPFYPFEEMFAEMDKKENLDFWGITKRGVSDFDGGDTIYPEHIQSYFYVVRERMLKSTDFIRYWETVTEKITDFRSAVINYEFMFTKHFSDRGYQWDVYCHTDDLVTDNPGWNLSPYHYCTYRLVKEGRCPLLKRKLFTGDFVEGRYSDKSDLKKAVTHIAQYTDYDVDLMWSQVLRTCHLGDILESMQMYEIVDAENTRTAEPGTCVRILDFRNSVMPDKDLDIVESSSAEYTLCICVEKKPGVPQVVFNAEKNSVIENMCPCGSYISAVAELFARNTRLGVLVSPMVTFGKISSSIGRKWQDESVAGDIQKQYQLTVPFGKNAPVHKINALWCRSHILSGKLLEDLVADRTGTVMQMIPLFAQQNGYYTEVLVNKTYAAGLMVNFQRTVRDIWDMAVSTDGEDEDLEAVRDRIYKQRIADFVRDKNCLYVYGAGQLACRAIRIIESTGSLAGVVVSDKTGNSDRVCGYLVMRAEDADLDGSSVVVAVGKKNNAVIEKKLKNLGVKDYLLLT